MDTAERRFNRLAAKLPKQRGSFDPLAEKSGKGDREQLAKFQAEQCRARIKSDIERIRVQVAENDTGLDDD